MGGLFCSMREKKAITERFDTVAHKLRQQSVVRHRSRLRAAFLQLLTALDRITKLWHVGVRSSPTRCMQSLALGQLQVLGRIRGSTSPGGEILLGDAKAR